jgi:putative DNA primase/helicase
VRTQESSLETHPPERSELLTERGLELRLARLLRERAYWIQEWKCWVYFSDREDRWVRDDPLWIERDGPALLQADLYEDLNGGHDSKEIVSSIKSLEKAALREKVLKGARAHCVGRPELLDSDPWLLGLPAGRVWDLRKGERRFADWFDFVSMRTKVLEGDGVCAEWLDFVAAILPDESEQVFLQRSLGAALIGEVREQRLYLWMGTGSNAKTTLETTLQATLGGYSTSSPADILAARRYPDADDQHKAMARFVGRRVVFLGELSRGATLNESLTKWITGGEPLVARRLHQDPFEVPNTATFFMLTNHLPRVPSGSDAIWRRITPLEFRQHFREDPEFMERMRTDGRLHASALRWLLDGCRDYLAEGLPIPKSVAEFRDLYREEEDHFDAWYEERVRQDPQARTRSRLVQEDYARWCRGQGITAMSPVELGRALAGKGHKNEPCDFEDDGRKRAYWGVALRTEAKRGE